MTRGWIRKLYTRLIVNHPAIAALLFLAVVAGIGMQIPKLDIDPSSERMFLNNDPIKPSYDKLIEIFGGNESTLVAIERKGSWLTETGAAELRVLEEELYALPNVLDVKGLTNMSVVQGTTEAVEFMPVFPYEGDPFDEARVRARARGDAWIMGNFLSEDESVAVFLVRVEKMSKSGKAGHQFSLGLDTLIQKRHALNQDMRIIAGGGPVFIEKLREAIGQDMRAFMPLVGLLLIAILFLTFRTFLGVLIPMIVVNIGILATLGFMAAAGFPITTVTVILPPLLLVIGITNVIHILNAYREAADQHPDLDARTQLHIGLEEVVGACTLSSITTAVGFASLALNDVDTVYQTGLIACVGIIATFLAAIVLTPVACSWFKLESIVSPKSNWQGGRAQTYLNHTANIVTNRPWFWTISISVLAIVVSLGAAFLQVETSLQSYFPEDAPVRQAGQFFEDHMSGGMPMEVLIEAGSYEALMAPASVAFLLQLEDKLLEHPMVHKAFGPGTMVEKVWGIMRGQQGDSIQLGETAADNQQAMFWYEMGDDDILRHMIDKQTGTAHISLRTTQMSSKELHGFVTGVQQFAAANKPADMAVQFADGSARFMYLVETLVPSQMRSLGLAMVIIWLVLIIALADIKLATLSMLPNVIPIMAVLGIMGWFGIELTFATSMIPSIAIGLAVDDTIHIFTRFWREKRRGLAAQAAALETMRETGRAVLYTSIILFAGFIILIASNFVPNRFFGILTSITTITAIAADLYMAPALLILAYRNKEATPKKTT